MRTLFIILALLIAGSSYAGKTTYRGCEGINQVTNFGDLAFLMSELNRSNNQGNSTNTNSANTIK